MNTDRRACRGLRVVPPLLLIFAALVIPTLVIASNAYAAASISDNFARANGGLGPNWTALSDGPLAISSQMVVGTNAGGDSGDIRTAEVYQSDQYSTVQVTSTPLTGTQWVGPMVRAQGTGSGLYVGFYFWNSGNPELMLFKRVNGTWGQLGPTYPSGALAAGTQLTLTAAASTLTFAENGATVITATDTALTGGAPGLMANQTAPNRRRPGPGGNVSEAPPHPQCRPTPSAAPSRGCRGRWSSRNNGADNLA